MADNREYQVGSLNQPQSARRGPGGPGGPGAVVEKPKSLTGAWGRLISYCRGYMPVVILLLALAVVSVIITLMGPGYISQITNLITQGLNGGMDIDAIWKIAVFIGVLYIIGALFSYGQSFGMATLSQRIAQKMRRDISHKLDRLPLKYFDATSYGDVLSRVTNDVDLVGQTLNQSIGNLMTGVVQFVGAAIIMLYTNWVMGLAGIITSLVGFLIMTLIISRSQKYFIKQQNDMGRVNGLVEEVYAGYKVVKVYNGVKGATEEFDKINEELYSSAWKSQFMSGLMMPLMTIIGNIGYVVICIVGASMVLSGSISFGVVVAFMIYIRLFTQPLTQMAQAATALQSTAAAAERVFEILDEEEMTQPSGTPRVLENAKGDVEFRHVKFGYSPDKTIIKDFSAKVKAGQKIAIVGPTGAGKSTIVNLLMRFYDPDSGEILIDGVPTSELTRENVHALFCMVLQDTWIFEGTVKENIIYCKENVEEEDVYSACILAGIDHFIRTMPEGYDTVLSDKSSISDGERQLITIARAMVENAPLLILDEATSSVDTRTEVVIQSAMDQLMEGRTSFVIAHRLSTIRNADLILVMRDGDIIESGNHDALMAQGGFYADLYNSQFDA
ncbi:MAG: ABC transporter ATP-binding protein/permease [Oscillospiraceae bacterium]|nr:ABC transporter ATP-binding protein/permease [Oscillospiraceae bacterium]